MVDQRQRSCTLLLHLASTIAMHCARATKTVTDKLRRVFLDAPRVVCDNTKFDCGLTTPLRDVLHWLDVPERVTCKLGVMV